MVIVTVVVYMVTRPLTAAWPHQISSENQMSDQLFVDEDVADVDADKQEEVIVAVDVAHEAVEISVEEGEGLQ